MVNRKKLLAAFSGLLAVSLVVFFRPMTSIGILAAT